MKPAAYLIVSTVLLATLAGGFWLGHRYAPGQTVSGSLNAAVTTAAAATPVPAAAKPGGRKILYYRNPMGLPDTSPEPKKDSMGMDYIPVYEGEEPDDGTTVKISLDKVQRLGVATEPAQLHEQMMRTVRAVGTVQLDERGMTAITAKVGGWIERLQVNTTGQTVRRGEPLLEIYSPDLVLAQQDYVIASHGLDAARSGGDTAAIAAAQRLVEGSLQRLRYWDISEDQLQRLQRDGAVQRRLTLRAPGNGQVMEKKVVEGMRIEPGEPLFELADLSHVWVVAEVFEQDLGLVSPGQTASISVASYPGETFTGTVDFIYPAVNPETRTGKIRIEISNPGGRLKEHMYATVELSATVSHGQVVTVPETALIDSGRRQVVLVEKSEGRYEPREVKTGARGDGLVEIGAGLAAGERVVVRANFLIDAESNLQSALRAFTAPKPEPGAAAAPMVKPAAGNTTVASPTSTQSANQTN